MPHLAEIFLFVLPTGEEQWLLHRKQRVRELRRKLSRLLAKRCTFLFSCCWLHSNLGHFFFIFSRKLPLLSLTAAKEMDCWKSMAFPYTWLSRRSSVKSFGNPFWLSVKTSSTWLIFVSVCLEEVTSLKSMVHFFFCNLTLRTLFFWQLFAKRSQRQLLHTSKSVCFSSPQLLFLKP